MRRAGPDRRVQHARHRRQPRASDGRKSWGEHGDRTDDEQHVASRLRSRLRDGAQREQQRSHTRRPFVRVDERGLRTVDRVCGERASRRRRRRDEVGNELVCEQRWRHQAAGDRREGDVGHDHADHPAHHGQHEEARHDRNNPIGRQIGPGGVQDIEEQQPRAEIQRASVARGERLAGGCELGRGEDAPQQEDEVEAEPAWDEDAPAKHQGRDQRERAQG